MAKKYIDVDKLKAEIERLKEPYQPYLSDFENGCREGRNNALDDIFSFINSLQQEQPEVDLEKEIDRWFGEKYMQNMVGLPIKPTVQIIARHFYELGRNTKKEE